MDRLFGSIALALCALFAAGAIGRAVVHDTRPLHPFIPAAAAATTGAGDAAAGKSFAAANCAMCHGLTAGAVMVGPSLYGAAGRPIAAVAGFDYSAALKAHAADSWTDAQLDAWLKSPSAFAAGTKMYYPGIADPKTRADVIAYLHTLGPAH